MAFTWSNASGAKISLFEPQTKRKKSRNVTKKRELFTEQISKFREKVTRTLTDNMCRKIHTLYNTPPLKKTSVFQWPTMLLQPHSERAEQNWTHRKNLPVNKKNIGATGKACNFAIKNCKKTSKKLRKKLRLHETSTQREVGRFPDEVNRTMDQKSRDQRKLLNENALWIFLDIPCLRMQIFNRNRKSNRLYHFADLPSNIQKLIVKLNFTGSTLEKTLSIFQ